MQDMQRCCNDPEGALGPDRVLTGAAFDPMLASMDDDTGDMCPAQGKFSLQELEIQAGDVLHIEYDFGGDSNIFTIQVLNVEEAKVLGEETLGTFQTRAKLVSCGEWRGSYSPPVSFKRSTMM